jgi:hypothetical protein
MPDSIPWELTADGKAARLVRARPSPRGSALALRLMAVEKMTAVSLVSAEFGGWPVVFEPASEALVDSGARVDFMALYETALPGEGDPAGLPAFCARRSVWVRDEDAGRLDAAASGNERPAAGSRIASRLVFLTRDEAAALVRLYEEAGSLVGRGVAVERARREDAVWHDLRFMFTLGGTRFELSYSPFASKSEALECWARAWEEAFARLDFGGGRVPDDGCRISYAGTPPELPASISGRGI